MSFSRTKFTIREVIKIFDVVCRNPYKRNKNPHYWQKILEKGMFPGRSVHSVNAQWQKFSLYGDKAAAVKKAMSLKMPYSVSFPQIPYGDDHEMIEKIREDLFTLQRGFVDSVDIL